MATQALLGCQVGGDVEGEARLSERRPGREDDQVAELEPARQIVQILEAGRRARDPFRRGAERLELLDGALQELVDRGERLLVPSLSQPEDLLLGPVQENVRVFGRLVGLADDTRPDGDQAPLHRVVEHDLDVIGDVGGRRDDVDDPGQILRSARPVEIAVPLELLPHRQRVGRMPLIAKTLNGLEDQAMRGMIEVVLDELLHGVVGRRLLDQHSTQDGDLGLVAVRRRPLRRAQRRHPTTRKDLDLIHSDLPAPSFPRHRSSSRAARPPRWGV